MLIAYLSFPLHKFWFFNIIISQIFRSEDKKDARYRLVGVIEHIGNSLKKGHYVAYVRGSRTGSKQQSSGSSTWFHADDSIIREVSLANVLMCEAYLLFYERIEDWDMYSSMSKYSEEHSQGDWRTCFGLAKDPASQFAQYHWDSCSSSFVLLLLWGIAGHLTDPSLYPSWGDYSSSGHAYW